MLATAILLPSLKSLDPTLINWAIVLLTEAVSPEEQDDKNNQDLNNDNNNAASSDKTGHDKDGKHVEGSSNKKEEHAGSGDHGWRFFAGVMRSSTANELLKDKPAGTFLVRKRAIDPTTSTDAEIAISLVDYEEVSNGKGKGKYSSTVVDMFIPSPFFKPVALPLSRSPVSKTPKQVFFNPIKYI